MELTLSLLTFGLKKAGDVLLGKLLAEKLEDRIESVIAAWAKELPSCCQEYLDPSSVLPKPRDKNRPEYSKCKSLVEKIESGAMPTKDEWFGVLAERQQNIARELGVGAAPFFRLSMRETEPHLNKLAHLIDVECARWDDLFKSEVIKMLRDTNCRMDEMEFASWKSRPIKEIALVLELREREKSHREQPEHFRVCLELQSGLEENRNIVIGGRDDFLPKTEGGFYFGTKTLFSRQIAPGPAWLPTGTQARGGIIANLRFAVRWLPNSFPKMQGEEFENLMFTHCCPVRSRIATTG